MTVIDLQVGAHSSPDDGMCLLEAVSYFAGEAFTDHPNCVSPSLAMFGRRLNDELPHDSRQQLSRLIPLLVGTMDPKVDQRDGLHCAHWCITHWLPTWMDLIPEMREHASELRTFPAPESWSDVTHWGPKLWDHRIPVGVISSDVSSDAIIDACWDVVWDVACDVALRIPSPFDTPDDRDIVRGVVWSIVRDVIWSVSRDLLPPIVHQLQQDTIDLFVELVEGRSNGKHSHT